MQQSSLPVDTIVTLNDAGSPVTNSWAIAEGVGNPHKSVIQLIRQNISDLKEFGRVAFENAPFETKGGTQNREVAILNEPQSTLLMTYMRNNAVVREFKKRLVRAFFEMARERQSQAPIRAFGSTGNTALDQRLDIEQGILERAGVPKGERMAQLLREAIMPKEVAAGASNDAYDSAFQTLTQQMTALMTQHFDFSQPPAIRATATEALQVCGITHPTRAQATAAGVALCNLNGREPMRTSQGNMHTLPQPLTQH